jgi:hypothetical protein
MSCREFRIFGLWRGECRLGFEGSFTTESRRHGGSGLRNSSTQIQDEIHNPNGIDLLHCSFLCLRVSVVK